MGLRSHAPLSGLSTIEIGYPLVTPWVYENDWESVGRWAHFSKTAGDGDYRCGGNTGAAEITTILLANTGAVDYASSVNQSGIPTSTYFTGSNAEFGILRMNTTANANDETAFNITGAIGTFTYSATAPRAALFQTRLQVSTNTSATAAFGVAPVGAVNGQTTPLTSQPNGFFFTIKDGQVGYSVKTNLGTVATAEPCRYEDSNELVTVKAATYYTFAIRTDGGGVHTFMMNGRVVKKLIVNGYSTPGLVCPFYTIKTIAGAAINMQIDYTYFAGAAPVGGR